MAHAVNDAYDRMAVAARQDALLGNAGATGAYPNSPMALANEALGMVGLFGKARGIMDDNQLRARTEEITKIAGENGGDMNSVPTELTQGRIGTIAAANVVDALSKTAEGKFKLQQNTQKLAEANFQNIQAGMAQAQEAISSGNHDMAAKIIENVSKSTASPYEFRHLGDGTFQKVFTGSPDGQPKPMDGVYTADQLMGETQKVLQDSPAFLKTVQQYTAATMQHNQEVSKNPDHWVEAKALDKDGKPGKKAREFIPLLNVVIGQPTQTGFYDPKDQKFYGSVDELMSAGYSAPETKSGALKQAGMDLKESGLAQKAAQMEQNQRNSEARIGQAAASVELGRQRLALEQEKASASEESMAIQRVMPQVGARVGLQMKNGAFGETDADGAFRTVDDSDPRVQRAMQLASEAVSNFKVGKGKGGTGPGLFGSNAPAPTINSYDAIVAKTLAKR